MKNAFLLLAGLFCSVLSYAQSNNPTADKDKLKVTLIKDSMFVIFKEQEVSIRSIQALDSLMKKIPDPKNLTVEFESQNGEAEKIRSINAVLKQCHCPTIRKSINFQKQ